MTTLELLDIAEEGIGNNLAWIADQVDLSIRQGDEETRSRLKQIRESWKAILAVRARQQVHDDLGSDKPMNKVERP